MIHFQFSDKLYTFTFNPPTWCSAVGWQKKSNGFFKGWGLSFHFSSRNFRLALLISFRIELQQNTFTVRLSCCVYGHVHGGWAVTFNFSVIRLWVSDLVLLTETELVQKCRKVSEFRIGDRKPGDTFFYLHSLSMLANMICKWLFLAVGLQHRKIRMCIMIILTCFKSQMLFGIQSFHKLYW